MSPSAARALTDTPPGVTTGVDGKFTLPEVLAGPFMISIDAEIGGVYIARAGGWHGDARRDDDPRRQAAGHRHGHRHRAAGRRHRRGVGAEVTIRIAGRFDRAYAQVQPDGTFTAIGVPLGQLSVYVADQFVAGYVESPDTSSPRTATSKTSAR